MGTATVEPRVLRKKGQATRYRTFPLRRERPSGKTEFQVFLGFDSQQAAERWIDDAINERLLEKAISPGAPGRPVRRPPPRAD